MLVSSELDVEAADGHFQNHTAVTLLMQAIDPA